MEFLNFRQLFVDTYIEIAKNPLVSVLKCSSDFEILSTEEIEWILQKVESNDGVKIPNEMKHLVLPDNAFLCWHYQMHGQKQTGGEFNLKATVAQYVDTTKTDFADTLTNYGRKLYKSGFRFFDSHPHAGDGIQIALKIENATVSSNVWYVDIIHEEAWELNLDYPSYIEHSIKLKGLYDWQYLFTDMDFRGLEFDISPLRKRLEDYPKLFPGADVNEYLKRYKDRHGS